MVRLTPVLILGFVLFIFFLLLPAAQATEGAVASIEMGDAAELYVTLSSDFAIVEAGRSMPVVVEVYDLHDIPLPGVVVHLSSTSGSVEPSQVRTDRAGRATFAFQSEAGETRKDVISAWVEIDGSIESYHELRVKVVQLPPPPIYSRTEVISVGIASLILGIVAKTEVGKYALLNFFTFPLYVRLKREEVLDHFVRGQIYGFVRTTPGAHYTMIKNALKVTNGTLSHHLKTLEVQGFITSRRDGVFKKFYPVDFEIESKGKGIRLSDLQVRLMNRLRPGGDEVLQGELAEALSVTQQCISYNLRLMERQGLLLKEKLGKRVRYRVVQA